MTAILDTAPAVPGLFLRAVSASRWRVVDSAGLIIGHVRLTRLDDASRFHAERLDPRGARWRELGAFWRIDEALECLRFSR